MIAGDCGQISRKLGARINDGEHGKKGERRKEGASIAGSVMVSTDVSGGVVADVRDHPQIAAANATRAINRKRLNSLQSVDRHWLAEIRDRSHHYRLAVMLVGVDHEKGERRKEKERKTQRVSLGVCEVWSTANRWP